MDGFFLYYMKSAFTMLKYRVFSYDANERILFMKLGSGMYKEIYYVLLQQFLVVAGIELKL